MEKSINDEGKIWGILYELQVSCWPSLVSECMFLLSQNDKQYNFILNHVMTGVHFTNSSSSSPARKILHDMANLTDFCRKTLVFLQLYTIDSLYNMV